MENFNTITWFLNLLAVYLVLLPVYYLLPRVALQQLLLIVSGAALFFVVAPRLLVFYVVYWVLVFALHRLVARTAGKSGGVWLFRVALVLALFPMLFWKLLPIVFYDIANLYGHLLLWEVLPRVGQIDAAKPIFTVIGLSYAAFRGVDVLIQTYLRVLPAQGWLPFWTYALFPPIQMVGPIAEYREVQPGNTPKRYDPANIAAGVGLLLSGIIKVYVLAYPLSPSTGLFTYFDTNPTWVLWWELLCFVWYFYLNFAGFTDFALGTARLVGYRLQGNFDWPFFRPNIQGFWNHWHMSLTRFAQRNVYVPAGGYRKTTQYRAIVATMMVIALWHDLSLSFLIFGLYHAAGLCIHRWWGQRWKAGPSNTGAHVLSVAGTFVFTGVSFPLIVLPPPLIVPFYGHLVGLL